MFESKPDPQLEALKKQLAEMISLQRDLLKKLEQQNTMLGSLATFVRDNSSSKPCFDVS
jgi:hypothetical protein